MTCLACTNNRAALHGLCREIPSAIIWLCRPYVNSGNSIHFCSQLLKRKENKAFMKMETKPPCVLVVIGVSTAETMSKEGIVILPPFFGLKGQLR